MNTNQTIEVPQEVYAAIERRAEAAGGKTVSEYLRSLYNPERREITTLAQLVAASTGPRERQFTLNGQPFKVMVRPLSAEESAEVDKLDSSIVPPRGKNGLPDEEDADYKARLKRARQMKRALAFSLGLLSFKIDGATLQEQTDNLFKMLPPGVIDEIWTAIFSLTSDPVEGALFS